MANEAAIINFYGNGGDPQGFTVAAGTSISGLSLMVMSDEQTMALSGNTNGERFAGIMTADKDGSDASTSGSVWTNVLADIKSVATAGLEGAIQVGDFVELSGVNQVRRLSGALTFDLLAKVVGQAHATASGGEVITVRILK
jgi:hypothetical protein